MIPNLDNTASEIVQYQRDSTVQRKDLAQKTKDFRKLDDSAKLGEIKGLLKGGYQFENSRDNIAYTNLQHIRRLLTS
jgi:homeobox protein cut-like